MADSVEIAFDPTTPLYCSRCGRRLEQMGHMTSKFLLCPVHGEFTIAPVVVKRADGWYMVTDQTTADMWATCEHLDRQRVARGNAR